MINSTLRVKLMSTNAKTRGILHDNNIRCTEKLISKERDQICKFKHLTRAKGVGNLLLEKCWVV